LNKLLLNLQDRNLLVVAFYEPRTGKTVAEREAALARQLEGLAEAIRLALRETVGARSGDVSCLLGGWGSRKDVTTGQFLDGPKEK